MSPAEQPWEAPSQGLLGRTNGVLLRLAAGYGAAALLLAASLSAPWRWAEEARVGGAGGLVAGAAILAAAALGSVWLVSSARGAPSVRPTPRPRRVPRVRVGRTGRLLQAVVFPLLAALAGLLAWRWRGWPPAPVTDGAVATGLAGVLALLAFPALVAERFAAAIPARVLPESASLRRVLCVPVAAAAAASAAEAVRAQGFAVAPYLFGAAAALLALQAAELAARGAARWFQPPVPPSLTRAPVGSSVAALPGWLLRPATAAVPLRAHFGIDFSRSWALLFLRAAILPAAVLTSLACWGLSGLAVLPLDGRGVYERLGRPVAVLGPGLHLLLPWPLGRVRPVALGTVREVSLGLGPAATGVAVAAEAPAPADADRLWDQPHGGEADWLIAGSGASGQSFQLISADLRVLYRVGLTDADAVRSAYAVADPDGLVRTLAGQVATGFFAGRTLDSVLDERREGMAAGLQAALEARLDRDRTGLEIVSVVVEAVHPPVAAAAAYHNVQAAEIIANTTIAAETGRAKGTASLARERSWDMLDKGQATAAELRSGADGDARRFAGDRAARQAGGRAFLLERYFQTVAAALSRSPLLILDHRLPPGTAPVIDLRPAAAAARATGADDSD